ncbi:MAG: leucine-rich repeat domain-containing protein [Lachnospiraceae bacterium]|nr:leucine-rich repeat domain-containing protein [Lachnospiraceae bacterium]
MARRIRKTIGVLLLITAFLTTQIPGYEAQATASLSDFQMDGSTLVKYTGSSSAVSIPSGVKKIGEEAFAGNTAITSVSIGRNVKEISYGAFRNCTGLSRVDMSDSVEVIGDAAFSNTAVSSMTLGASLKSLGSGVFAGCGHLTNISISKDNEDFSFDGRVLYDEDRTQIYCYVSGNTTGTYTMPSTVTKVHPYAFWGNTHLQQISLSSNLAEISGYTFSNCSALQGIAIPYSVANIDAKAFENCGMLQDVVITPATTYLHGTAFDGCPRLNIIADPYTAAYDYFTNWKASRPAAGENEGGGSTVSTNDVGTLGGESGNDSASQESSDHEAGGVYVVGGGGQVTQQSGSGEVTEPSNGQTGQGGSMPSGYGNPASAIHDPSNVDYIPLGDPLENMGEDVLGQTMIVSGQAVVLMDGNRVEIISGLHQPGVSSGEEQEAHQAVVDAGKGSALPKYSVVGDRLTAYAYYGEEPLTSYAIPEHIRVIGEFAFARSGLEEMVIPAGVTSVGYAAFYHCDNLSEVTIPDSVTHIDACAFSYTKWLTDWLAGTDGEDFLIVGDGILLAYRGNGETVQIPEAVKTIAPGCFMDRDEIKTVILPAALREIGEEAFQNCSGLETIQGGNGLRRIGDRAFQGTGLRSVTIPASVEAIGVGAFDCSHRDYERTVTFEGTTLPALSYGARSTRLDPESLRTPAFYGNWTAYIGNSTLPLEKTVLEEGSMGFTGTVAVTGGGTIGQRSYDKGTGNGVYVTSSLADWESGRISAAIPAEGIFHLKIAAGDEAAVTGAMTRVYGDQMPQLYAFSMELYEATDSVAIKKLGDVPLTVTVPLPENLSGNTIHAAVLDGDGQLEKLSAELVQTDGGDAVRFTTVHLSEFVIYAYGEGETGIVIKDGDAQYTAVSGKKDYSPNTGDNSIHPKWFLALGIGFTGAACILYRPAKNRR